MIYFITGQPGAGKTLRALWLLKNDSQFKDRDVYSNIEGAGFRPLPSDGWVGVPDGAVVVIDEAQHWFPQRRPGAQLPSDVSQMDTHRHRGIDLILTTQRPTGVDHHVRGLVGRHEHLRAAGTGVATIWVRDEAWDSMDSKERRAGQTDSFRWPHPKELYGSYSSAVMHTQRQRIPRKVIWFGAAVVGLLMAIGYSVYSVQNMGMEHDGTLDRVASADDDGSGVRDRDDSGATTSPVVRQGEDKRRSFACVYWEESQECRCVDGDGYRAEISWDECIRRADGYAPSG